MRVLAPILLSAWIAFSPASAQDLPDEPLSECEDVQRCAYDERVYEHDADLLFAYVRRAINRMSPVDLQVNEDLHQLSAAFRVFFFLDDLSITLKPVDKGTKLYIRSESRSTFWDGGTNKRRINGFFDRLEDLLAQAAPELEDY